MKLKVLQPYAERLNVIARTDPSVWNRVIRLTACLIRQENGHRNAYPSQAHGLVVDTDTKAALLVIARASDRAQWVFQNMAAREVLRQQQVGNP